MYIFVAEDVLQRQISSDAKLILAYFLLLKKASRHYYGSRAYLAGLLGMTPDAVNIAIDMLLDWDLVEGVFEGKPCKENFKGFKAV